MDLGKVIENKMILNEVTTAIARDSLFTYDLRQSVAIAKNGNGHYSSIKATVKRLSNHYLLEKSRDNFIQSKRITISNEDDLLALDKAISSRLYSLVLGQLGEVVLRDIFENAFKNSIIEVRQATKTEDMEKAVDLYIDSVPIQIKTTSDLSEFNVESQQSTFNKRFWNDRKKQFRNRIYNSAYILIYLEDDGTVIKSQKQLLIWYPDDLVHPAYETINDMGNGKESKIKVEKILKRIT